MQSSSGGMDALLLGPMLRHLVSRYAIHKVRQRRFSAILQTSVRGQKECHPSVAALVLRITGDEVLEDDRKIRRPFSTAAAERIISENKHLFSDEAFDKTFSVSLSNLAAIISEMGDLIFKEKRHWGNIAAFLAFTGSLAAYCTEKKKMSWSAVSDVVKEAFAEYVERNLGDWIRDNGGPDILNSALDESTKYYNDCVWRKIGYSQLLHSTSKAFMQKKDYGSAKASLDLALEIHKIFSIEDKKRAELLYDLGLVFQRQHAYKEAVKVFEQAQEMRMSVLGKNGDSFVADCLFQMGMSVPASDFSKALSYHQFALDIRERLHPRDIRTAESYYIVACMNYNATLSSLRQSVHKQKMRDAMTLIGKACSIWKEVADSADTQNRKTLVEMKKFMKSAAVLCDETQRTEVSQVARSHAIEIRNLLHILEKRLSGHEGDGQAGLAQLGNDDSFQMPHALELHTAGGHDQEAVVPPEVIARGPEACQAFQKALSEGETRVRRIPVMLIGQERAGKTSLKKSLKGEKFDPEEQSTRGIDIDPSLCKVTTDMWRARNDGSSGENVADAVSYERHAAILTLKHLRALKENGENTSTSDEPDIEEEKSETEPEKERCSDEKAPDKDLSNVDAKQISEPSIENNDQESQTQASTIDVPSYSDNKPKNESTAEEGNKTFEVAAEIPEEIARLVETLLQNDELEDDKEVYCTLWDFAGQSVFYATHSLFLTRRAIYLLVNDLSRDPHQAADASVKRGSFKRIHDKSLAITNLDFLHFWMTSVASLAECEEHEDRKGLPARPPVIFVSTHADEPFADGDPRDLAREIYGNLQSKPYKSHLVKDFYAVDNRRSGSQEEDPEVARIRKKILDTACDPEKVPVKWLKFEKTMRASVKEGFNFLKFSEAEEIARKVCDIIGERAFRAVLDFLHDHRVVVHFDDTRQLDDLVIINPQWLIDVFKEVITVRPFEKQQSGHEEHWRKLEDSGVLKRELLDHVWSHLVSDQDTVEALISIMEKFSLICRWPSSTTTEEYLVPHMMMSHPVTEDLKKLMTNSCAPSIFIRFFSGPNLQVLFPHLLVNLIREWPEEWSDQRQPELFRNAARLFFDSRGSCLILLCHSGVIEVGLYSPSTPSGTDVMGTCSRIHAVLLSALERVRAECRWLRLNAFDLCFRCPVCCEDARQKSRCSVHHVTGCPEVECLHFFSAPELRELKHPITCNRPVVVMDTTVPVQTFSCWLGESTDEADGGAAQGMPINLSSDVISVLDLHSTDPKEIVKRATDNLNLDEDALKKPSAETVQKVRRLADLVKKRGRVDALKQLRKMVPSGTTGPLLNTRLRVCHMPYKERKDLTVHLSGGDEWKIMAEKLGLSNDETRFLDKRTRNPADAVLTELEKREPCCTVGYLYDVLVECDMPTAADIM